MKSSESGVRPVAATYPIKEAAKLLGIGINQAYQAAAKGDIPSIRVGGRVLVPRTALNRLLGLDG